MTSKITLYSSMVQKKFPPLNIFGLMILFIIGGVEKHLVCKNNLNVDS